MPRDYIKKERKKKPCVSVTVQRKGCDHSAKFMILIPMQPKILPTHDCTNSILRLPPPDSKISLLASLCRISLFYLCLFVKFLCLCMHFFFFFFFVNHHKQFLMFVHDYCPVPLAVHPVHSNFISLLLLPFFFFV